MQPAQEVPLTSPLGLAHIQARIASFLGGKDALSCMCVSRDWFHDFAPSVWHTIDFAKDSIAFATIAPEVLDKHGDLISQALNITTEDQLESLQSTNVDSLKRIEALVTISCVYHQLLSDTIRRNRGSVQSIAIHGLPPNPDTLEEQWKHLHTLVASFGQVWDADPNGTSAPPLLAHFPLLKEWALLRRLRTSSPALLMVSSLAPFLLKFLLRQQFLVGLSSGITHIRFDYQYGHQ
ncbi:hypothetical protein BG015_011974 [Linnemannia schmuckeri]|uniref:F-box domain-containing protein n=1 Tax=Linnemannia schmuckeri TaxID=64567 RepID=A0A9P5S6U5_9FUNG|nr:hypothetical protein BG015_011974 [Linnemannia schmuckeri]